MLLRNCKVNAWVKILPCHVQCSDTANLIAVVNNRWNSPINERISSPVRPCHEFLLSSFTSQIRCGQMQPTYIMNANCLRMPRGALLFKVFARMFTPSLWWVVWPIKLLKQNGCFDSSDSLRMGNAALAENAVSFKSTWSNGRAFLRPIFALPPALASLKHVIELRYRGVFFSFFSTCDDLVRKMVGKGICTIT